MSVGDFVEAHSRRSGRIGLEPANEFLICRPGYRQIVLSGPVRMQASDDSSSDSFAFSEHRRQVLHEAANITGQGDFTLPVQYLISIRQPRRSSLLRSEEPGGDRELDDFIIVPRSRPG
jgi:hypothetical protein